MYVPSELEVIGKLAEDPVATSYAAHDLGGEPVLLVSGLVPLRPDDLEPYTRWAETLVNCARHPYIADVVTHGVAEGRAYVAVRTGHRRTLSERLASSGPLPYKQVWQLGVCLADALATAHQADLFHLAVRPEAIYLDDELGPVLSGFDAAAPVLKRPMATGPLSAPEFHVPRGQMDGQMPVVGAAADVYALAATLYLALGGVLPWNGESPTWVDPAVRAVPLPHLPGVPPALVEILRSGLAVSPRHRPTAARLRDALREPRTRTRGTAADPADGAEFAVGSMPGLALPLLVQPPDGSQPERPREPDAPDPRSPLDPERAGRTAPEPPELPAGDFEDMKPLAGSWQIATDTGERELMVVERNGAVTWTGADESGPFVATGEALPLGGGGFRLLLNEPAGAAGFFVDLRVDDGALSFTMDQAPADGVVDAVNAA